MEAAQHEVVRCGAGASRRNRPPHSVYALAHSPATARLFKARSLSRNGVRHGRARPGRKLDFLFNQNIDLSNTYNAARAAGNASRIGIADTPANRAEVAELFNKAYSDSASILGPGAVPGSNLREFYLPGSTGTGSKIQFVELNGKVLTIIAK